MAILKYQNIILVALKKPKIYHIWLIKGIFFGYFFTKQFISYSQIVQKIAIKMFLEHLEVKFVNFYDNYYINHKDNNKLKYF